MLAVLVSELTMQGCGVGGTRVCGIMLENILEMVAVSKARVCKGDLPLKRGLQHLQHRVCEQRIFEMIYSVRVPTR